MSKFRILLFAVVGILFSAMTTFAQAEGAAGAGDNAFSVNKYRALAAGIGFCDCRVGWCSRTVAHRRGSVRGRSAKSWRRRSYPNHDDSWFGAD